jgi:glycine cleavage system H protein
VVLEINEELEDSPENLNEDPYGAWIIKVENVTGEEELLTAEEYEAHCAEEG